MASDDMPVFNDLQARTLLRHAARAGLLAKMGAGCKLQADLTVHRISQESAAASWSRLWSRRCRPGALV